MKKLLIIAGEASGDLHGGQLVAELRKIDPGMEIFGIGGDRMQQAGMELIYHIRDFSFMGFWEVLGHLPFVRQAMIKLERLLVERKPEVVVLIDYPGFNLRFARMAKRHGVRVAYFISPQVWAWGRGRVRRIRRLVDRMLCILPFEKEFYRRYRVDAHYVGNPLLDLAKPSLSRESFFHQHRLKANQPLVGLLPGSRHQEVEKILPVMLGTSKMLQGARPEMQFAIGMAPSVEVEMVERETRKFDLEPILIFNHNYDLMAHSDLILTASGTATLECGIIGTPLIIIYRTSWFSYLLGRMLVKVPYIGLVNLVAGKKVAPEFIQHEARPGAIFLMAQMMLAEGRPRQVIKGELEKIPGILGQPGAAGRAAREIMDLFQR